MTFEFKHGFGLRHPGQNSGILSASVYASPLAGLMPPLSFTFDHEARVFVDSWGLRLATLQWCVLAIVY